MEVPFYVKDVPLGSTMFGQALAPIIGSHQEGGASLSLYLLKPFCLSGGQTSQANYIADGTIHMSVRACEVRRNPGGKRLGVAFVTGACKQGEVSELKLEAQYNSRLS